MDLNEADVRRIVREELQLQGAIDTTSDFTRAVEEFQTLSKERLQRLANLADQFAFSAGLTECLEGVPNKNEIIKRLKSFYAVHRGYEGPVEP